MGRDAFGAVIARYASFGVALGALFPLGGVVFLLATGSLGTEGGLVGVVARAHRTEPLMWVLWAAPALLGLFAGSAGAREARIRRFSARLEIEVAEKTESLRSALVEARHANETIAHMADHDPLTGLYNRRRLREELQRVVAHAKRFRRHAAVLFVDLDDLKSINDIHGHEAGDEMLRGAAAALREITRTTDFACRWGGDEFALVLSETSREGACVLAERIVTTLRARRVRLGTTERQLSCSVGVAVFPEVAEAADDLIVRADAAMYRAKRAGGGSWHAFRGDHTELGRIRESRRWAARVRQALDSDRFLVVYQPVVRLATGTCWDYEALVRMEDVRGDLVQPALFVEAAEESGLGPSLDRLVVDKVLRRIASTSRKPDPPSVSVNLFQQTLLTPGLSDKLREMAANTGADLRRLSVEIPDWSAAQNLVPLEPMVDELRRLGCRIVVDGLGAGFLSLLHLQRLGVAAVKLHRTLVEGIETNPEASRLLRSFTQSLKGIGIDVVAKCVEDPARIPILFEHGIDLVQGYAVGRPRESLEASPSLPRVAVTA